MPDSKVTSCVRHGCKETASKIVRFAYRIVDPELIPTIHELILCDTHIEDIKQHFLAVIELDLDDRGDAAPTLLPQTS